ncbi:MAG: cell division protein FtsA [Bacteroides sp.]|nr:MAG: cell division protein FtsA [Bacteroides sp.]
MKKFDISISLDIGTSKICTIIGYKNLNDKIEIIGIHKSKSYSNVKRNSMSESKIIDSIENAIKIASTKINFDNRSISVGIASENINKNQYKGILIRNNDNNIKKEDIDILTQNMKKSDIISLNDKIIHIIPQEFLIDDISNIISPIGLKGKKISTNFHIITSNNSFINDVYTTINKSKFVLENIIYNPIATAEAVLTDEEKESGVALIDIGAGKTDLIIIKNNIIKYFAMIPLGGNEIDYDIQEGCMVMHKHAENLKIKFGSALLDNNDNNHVSSIPGLKGRNSKKIYSNNINYIIQIRMEEIIEYIYYEILNSGYDKKLFGGIVITGGMSKINNIKKLVELLTGLEVRIGYSNENVICDDIDISDPEYATCVGLVIKSLNDNNSVKQNYVKNNFIQNFKHKLKQIKNIIYNKDKMIYNEFEKTSN